MIRLTLDFQKGTWEVENPSGQRGYWHPDGYPTEWARLKTAVSKLRRILRERPAARYNIFIQEMQVSMTSLQDWPEGEQPPLPFEEQLTNLEQELFGWQKPHNPQP